MIAKNNNVWTEFFTVTRYRMAKKLLSIKHHSQRRRIDNDEVQKYELLFSRLFLF